MVVVVAVIGVDRNIFPPTFHTAQKAVAAGWLVTAIVDILWVIYFSAEENSSVFRFFTTIGGFDTTTSSSPAQGPGVPPRPPSGSMRNSTPGNAASFHYPPQIAGRPVSDGSKTQTGSAVDGGARTTSGVPNDGRVVSGVSSVGNTLDGGDVRAPVASMPGQGPPARSDHEGEYLYRAEALFDCVLFPFLRSRRVC